MRVKVTGGAFGQDSRPSLGHLGDRDQVTRVTAVDWIVKGVDAYARLVPVEVRTFPPADLDAAKTWVAS